MPIIENYSINDSVKISNIIFVHWKIFLKKISSNKYFHFAKYRNLSIEFEIIIVNCREFWFNFQLYIKSFVA